MISPTIAAAREALARNDKGEALALARAHLAEDSANTDAATIAVRAADNDEAGEVIALVRRTVAANADPGAQISLLLELLPLVERHERAMRGLSPGHVLDLREFPFHFCAAEISAIKQIWETLPPDAPARVSLGPGVEFVLGHLEEADRLLVAAAARAPQKKLSGGYATVRYARDFYVQLDQVRFDGLPQVSEAKPAQFASGNVLYAGCDAAYFQTYGIPLLRSLAARAPGADAHVHLMLVEGSGDVQIPELALNLRVTYEVIHKGLDSPLYYHAMRLVRLYQFLDDRTLWMADVDGLVNSNPAVLYARLKSDVGIRVSPGRTQPWNRFNASLVAATPRAKDYFRRVAAYLTTFIMRGQFSWGMDQMALYGVYACHPDRPSLQPWGPDDFDPDGCRPDAAFWYTAGAFKKDYASGAKEPPPAQANYWRLFRSYAAEPRGGDGN